MMASIKTTPEKVKNLLSSFIASSKYQSKLKPVSPSSSTDEPVRTDLAKDNKSTSSLRSFESFLERLDSFSSITWFGKPVDLSPLICARYGWTNSDADSLKCVSCKAHLCVQLPDPSDSEAYQKFKEKLKKEIVTSHDKFCLIAANPCPEHFCQITIDDTTSLVAEFCDRVASLCSIPDDNLPSLDYSSLHSHEYDQVQTAAYCRRNFPVNAEPSPEVVTLSVAGWSCLNPSSDLLICAKCRRQVGMWNFRQNSQTDTLDHQEEKETDTLTDNDPPAAKIPKTQIKSFNPVEEHKHWCPWVRPTIPSIVSSTPPTPVRGKRAREESPALPALIVALRTMTPGLHESNTGLAQAMKASPMADGLRCLSHVLKTWSSKKSPPKPTEAPSSESS